MRRWKVGGAVVERASDVLLVRNRRRGDRVDWSPPGGVIDEGEGVVDGLTREVQEETGLTVTDWDGPIYRVEAVASEMRWHLEVEAYRAVDYRGQVVVDDPDGIVDRAEFVGPTERIERISTCPRWVCEPFETWMEHRFADGRWFRYDVSGTGPADLSVTLR